MLISKMRW
jgi:hypothetical protein